MRWTRRKMAGLAALLALAGPAGCVERRYTIRTEPPGAQAIVNGEEIGTTPVSRSYVYHAPRNIRIIKDGFQTLDVVQEFEPPWYDNLLTEFFTENLIPYTFRDERTLTYTLKPEVPTDANRLLNSGESLRSQAQAIPPPRPEGFLALFGFGDAVTPPPPPPPKPALPLQ